MPRENAHRWLVERLEEEESYVERAMFGCRACYVHGRLMLVLADTEEPWNGVLVATDRDRHDRLRNEFPSLVSHPVLGKWLYLSAEEDDFESVAQELVACAAADDPRFGVAPAPNKRPRKKR